MIGELVAHLNVDHNLPAAQPDIASFSPRRSGLFTSALYEEKKKKKKTAPPPSDPCDRHKKKIVRKGEAPPRDQLKLKEERPISRLVWGNALIKKAHARTEYETMKWKDVNRLSSV